MALTRRTSRGMPLAIGKIFPLLVGMAMLGAVPSAWSACGNGGAARAPNVPVAIGVVDVLTERSSVCVNGLEIRYEDATPVTINGRPASAKALALGQVVAIEARPAPGQLEAQNIAILRVLEGPATGVDGPAQTVFVMGQAVRVTDETRSPMRREELESIPPGATVQVSGYRNARGQIVASRLDVAPPGEHSAIGRMRQIDARTGQIGKLPVSLPGTRGEGDGDVLVRGRWDGASLRAGTVAEDPSMRLLEGSERVVVESLVLEPRRGDSLRVGDLQVRIGRGTTIPAAGALRIDQRVLVTGVPDRRRGIAAERIEVPPPAARGGGTVADRRPAATGDREQSDRQRADSDPEPGRPERVERMERFEPARVERSESARVEPVRVERSEPVRVERSEPVRIERIERPERRERDDGRIERAERSDRSGSNRGRD
jgi:hypothetical protein